MKLNWENQTMETNNHEAHYEINEIFGISGLSTIPWAQTSLFFNQENRGFKQNFCVLKIC